MIALDAGISIEEGVLEGTDTCATLDIVCLASRALHAISFTRIPILGQEAGHALLPVELGLVGWAAHASVLNDVVDLVVGAALASQIRVVEVFGVITFNTLFVVPEAVLGAVASCIFLIVQAPS